MAKHSCNKETEIAEIHKDVKYIKEMVQEIKQDVKKNTEFRQRTKGIIGFVAFLFTALGAGIIYIINKIRG